MFVMIFAYTNRVVDVLGDGLVWRLVLAADSQPDVPLIPLYEPAVPPDRPGQSQEHQGRQQEREEQGG